MKKLLSFSLALTCAALLSPAWAADDSQPQGAGANSTSTELQQLKTQLEQQQKQIVEGIREFISSSACK